MSKIEIKSYNKSKVSDMLVLSGRQLGYDMREYFKLNEKDMDNNRYEVVFPDNIISLSTSYFLALFGDSVRKEKNREAFLEKYQFICDQNLKMNINDGIVDALNDVDGLS